MNKKHVVVLSGCVALVIAAMGTHLWRYKHYSLQLAETISAQQKLINDISTQRDALANQQPKTIPCASPAPMQTAVQAVLDPAPEEKGDSQTQIDGLKKRYEDILVTYFLLRKCDKIEATDYHIIISALSQEMASVNAPGRLQYDILTSAQGSYKELYSGNDCDPATIGPLEESYKAFVQGINSEFMPQ